MGHHLVPHPPAISGNPEGKVHLVPDSLVGKNLASLRLGRFPGMLLLALKTKEGWTYNPPSDCVIRPESTLIFIGGPEDRVELEKKLAG